METTYDAISTPEKPHESNLPSPSAFFIEGGKLANSSTNIPIVDISRRLGINAITTACGINHDQDRNLTNGKRVKAVSLIAASEALKTDDTQEKAVDFILTDGGLRADIHIKAEMTSGEISTSEARNRDLSFIRTLGGRSLEARVINRGITIERAISLGIIFERYPNLEMIDRARIINSIMGVRESPEITNLAQKITKEVQINEYSLKGILMVGFGRKVPDNTALSSFSDEVKRIYEDLLACRNSNDLNKRLNELINEGTMPESIDSLSAIVDILKANPNIKAVSVDLYDTLIQWTSNQRERRNRMNELSCHVLQKNHGISVDGNDFKRASSQAWTRRWTEFQKGGTEVDIKDTLGWIVEDIVPRASKDQKEEIVKDLEKTWYKVELETATPVPEAIDALKKIKALGRKICLTSNASWSKQHIDRVLRTFGLDKYFDAVSYSGERGTMKTPSLSDFFHYSWGKMGIQPQDILHVGDSKNADVIGAKNAGGNAVLYRNPGNYFEIETDRKYRDAPEEYKNKTLEFFNKSQNSIALERIRNLIDKRKIPQEERERIGGMAREVYQKTRDVAGPAYIALSDLLLRRLSDGKSDVNICLARDALPLAIAQKLLLSSEPDRYPGASSEQIKYTYISRAFLDRYSSDPEFATRYRAYLDKLGLTKANNITLTDLLSGSGKTHRGVEGILKGQKVEGFYLDVLSKVEGAHSFLKDSLNNPTANLSTKNMLILFEALFSGPFESANDIELKTTGQSPKLERKNPSPNVLVRGLSKESILLLQEIAIKGLMDSVAKTHRRRLLKIADPDKRDVMQRFYAFVQNKPSHIWTDIWRSVPWQDKGEWYIASQNDAEKSAKKAGKI